MWMRVPLEGLHLAPQPVAVLVGVAPRAELQAQPLDRDRRAPRVDAPPDLAHAAGGHGALQAVAAEEEGIVVHGRGVVVGAVAGEGITDERRRSGGAGPLWLDDLPDEGGAVAGQGRRPELSRADEGSRDKRASGRIHGEGGGG